MRDCDLQPPEYSGPSDDYRFAYNETEYKASRYGYNAKFIIKKSINGYELLHDGSGYLLISNIPNIEQAARAVDELRKIQFKWNTNTIRRDLESAHPDIQNAIALARMRARR